MLTPFVESNYGFTRMSVCEFLHCTLNELSERCNNIADYYTIVAYMVKKDEKINKSMPKR